MRSKEEIRRIVEGFAKSGLTRREYCAKHGVGISALDYWRRAQRRQKPTLLPVALEEAQPLSPGFALVLTNGRRIECSWGFAEADLKRLVRAAEA